LSAAARSSHLVVDPHQLDEIFRGALVELATLQTGIDEGLEANLGDHAGAARGDVAIKMRDAVSVIGISSFSFLMTEILKTAKKSGGRPARVSFLDSDGQAQRSRSTNVCGRDCE